MAKESKSCSITINMANNTRLQTVKTILGYESVVRGLTLGQTFAQIILETADIDNYPDEVKQRLLYIKERTRQSAAVRSLETIVPLSDDEPRIAVV